MKNIVSIFFFMFLGKIAFTQSIVITPTKVEANSSTKPSIITRMSSTAMWNIQSPIKGTIIYDLTNNVLRMYDGANWVRFKSFGNDISPTPPPMAARKENETVYNQSQPIPSKQ